MSMGEGCAEPTVCTVALIYDLYIKAITLDPCDIRKSKRNSKIGSASRRNPCFYPLRTRVGTLIPQEYSTPSLGLSQPIPRHGSTRGRIPLIAATNTVPFLSQSMQGLGCPASLQFHMQVWLNIYVVLVTM